MDEHTRVQCYIPDIRDAELRKPRLEPNAVVSGRGERPTQQQHGHDAEPVVGELYRHHQRVPAGRRQLRNRSVLVRRRPTKLAAHRGRCHRVQHRLQLRQPSV